MTRCLIRACLLLSLWNLPFPFVHNHDLALGAEQGNWLPSHLKEYHAVPKADEHGWHLHFVYFGMDDCNNPLEKKFPLQHHFIVGETASSLPACEHLSIDEFRSMEAEAIPSLSSIQESRVLPRDRDRTTGLHFMQAFQQRSLRDLISISLC